MIFQKIMSGKSKTIEEAMKNASIETVNEATLDRDY